MNALTPNPTTGFLESVNPATFEAFDSNKKLKAIELGMEYARRRELPDIASICDALGISDRCFQNHLKTDDKFAEAWGEIKSRVFSGLCNELSIKAKSANGIVANIAVLRYLESGTFNPESRVVYTSDNTTVKGLIGGINSVIEAELVPPDNK